MPRKETPTLSAAIGSYMLTRSHCAASTILNDRSVLHRFAADLGEHRQVGYITREQVMRVFVAIGEQQKPSSFNKVRQRVGGLFQYCRSYGWVKTDLLVDVKARPVPQVERRKLPGDELVLLPRLVPDTRDQAFLVCGANTVLRASEITALKVRDVAMSHGELSVYRQKPRHYDVLWMTPRLETELRKWLVEYADEIGRPVDDDDYLFPARFAPRFPPGVIQTGRQVHELGALRPRVRMTHPARVVQRALRSFGFSSDQIRGEGLHLLRRSAAREYYEYALSEGHPAALRATQAFLGHKSIITTELYLGLNADRQRRNQILRGGDFLPYASNVTPMIQAG